MKEADLDRADNWFDRYDGVVVFFGRMVPGIRSVVSIPAGLSEMPLGRFVVLTVLGSCVWNHSPDRCGVAARGETGRSRRRPWPRLQHRHRPLDGRSSRPRGLLVAQQARSLNFVEHFTGEVCGIFDCRNRIGTRA